VGGLCKTAIGSRLENRGSKAVQAVFIMALQWEWPQKGVMRESEQVMNGTSGDCPWARRSNSSRGGTEDRGLAMMGTLYQLLHGYFS
jgi:hypothetical protein